MMNECVESVDERIHPGFLPSESSSHVVIGALHVRRGTIGDLPRDIGELDNGVENEICKKVQEFLRRSNMGVEETSKRYRKDDDAAPTLVNRQVVTRGDASMAKGHKDERPVKGGHEKTYPQGSTLRTVALDRILNTMDSAKSIDTKPMQTKSSICGTKSVDNKSMDSSKSIDGSMYMGSNSLIDLYGNDRWSMEDDSQGEGSFRRTATIRRALASQRNKTHSSVSRKTMHPSVSGKTMHSSVSGKTMHSSVSRNPKSDLANFMNAVTSMVEEQGKKGNKDFKIVRDGDVVTLQQRITK